MNVCNFVGTLVKDARRVESKVEDRGDSIWFDAKVHSTYKGGEHQPYFNFCARKPYLLDEASTLKEGTMVKLTTVARLQSGGEGKPPRTYFEVTHLDTIGEKEEGGAEDLPF